MSSRAGAQRRRSTGVLIPLLCAGAILSAVPAQAQSISGPDWTKAPSDPAELLQMLRTEWGLHSVGATGAEEPSRRIGDELTEGLEDPDGALQALLEELHRAVKLIESGHYADERGSALKKAAMRAEGRIRAAVDGLRDASHPPDLVAQVIREAFSEYLTAFEALIAST